MIERLVPHLQEDFVFAVLFMQQCAGNVGVFHL